MSRSGHDNTQNERVASVARVEDERAQAIVDADIATLDRLTAPDYVHVETSGRVRSKAEFLDALDPAAGRYERYENQGNCIQLHGDTAIVTGWFENAYRRSDGARFGKRARHIRVYVLMDGSWLNMAHQATECPPVPIPLKHH